jgi:hypothetical protein
VSIVAANDCSSIAHAARQAYATGDLEAAHTSRLDLAELSVTSPDPSTKVQAAKEFERLGGDMLTVLHMFGALYSATENAIAARIAGDQNTLDACLERIGQFAGGEPLDDEVDVDAICANLANRSLAFFSTPRPSAVVPFSRR